MRPLTSKESRASTAFPPRHPDAEGLTSPRPLPSVPPSLSAGVWRDPTATATAVARSGSPLTAPVVRPRPRPGVLGERPDGPPRRLSGARRGGEGGGAAGLRRAPGPVHSARRGGGRPGHSAAGPHCVSLGRPADRPGMARPPTTWPDAVPVRKKRSVLAGLPRNPGAGQIGPGRTRSGRSRRPTDRPSGVGVQDDGWMLPRPLPVAVGRARSQSYPFPRADGVGPEPGEWDKGWYRAGPTSTCGGGTDGEPSHAKNGAGNTSGLTSRASLPSQSLILRPPLRCPLK